MPNTNIQFKETLLNQIKEYLDGKITKEQYYEQAESFYSEYAASYDNPEFHECFLNTVADACMIYIDEPGLTPEVKNKLFHQSLSEAYVQLQKI